MDGKLKEILEELKKELGIKERVKIVKKDYKRKLGSVSIEKKEIRISKKILNDEKLLRKVLYHELLHIKLKTKWHTPEFWEL